MPTRAARCLRAIRSTVRRSGSACSWDAGWRRRRLTRVACSPGWRRLSTVACSSPSMRSASTSCCASREESSIRSHLRMNGRWHVGRDGEEARRPPVARPACGGAGGDPVERPRADARHDAGRADRPGPPRRRRGAGGARPSASDGPTPAGCSARCCSISDSSRASGTCGSRRACGPCALSPWLPLGRASDEELAAALAWARREMRAAVSGARPQRAVYRRSRASLPALWRADPVGRARRQQPHRVLVRRLPARRLTTRARSLSQPDGRDRTACGREVASRREGCLPPGDTRRETPRFRPRAHAVPWKRSCRRVAKAPASGWPAADRPLQTGIVDARA